MLWASCVCACVVNWCVLVLHGLASVVVLCTFVSTVTHLISWYSPDKRFSASSYIKFHNPKQEISGAGVSICDVPGHQALGSYWWTEWDVYSHQGLYLDCSCLYSKGHININNMYACEFLYASIPYRWTVNVQDMPGRENSVKFLSLFTELLSYIDCGLDEVGTRRS